MGTKIIDLTGLSTFLSKVKDWVASYFDSRIDSELSTTSTNPVSNSVVTSKIQRMVWKGTQSELEAAIEAGLVDDDTIIIIEDDEEELVFEFAKYEEILALFHQYITT